jgi:exonuclease SbcD
LKFIHASDLHLDSPMRGLEKYEGAPVESIRSSCRAALIKLVDTALQEKVDFILLAGDIYDGDWRDISTGMFFINQMNRLRESNINVYLIKGNHDAAAQISSRLPFPPNVHEFASIHPHTMLIPELKTAIHGQSFATRAIKDNLVMNYPPAEPGYFNIGLLHTSINGREGHDHYAPCSLQDMIDKTYDYWALGHVHRREIVLAGEPTWIVFSGNPQGRSIRETGPKGCTLVTVNEQVIEKVEHINLNVMRWELLKLDATGLKEAEGIYELFRQALDNLDKSIPLAVRLIITGSCRAHYQFAAQTEQWKDRLRMAVMNSYHDIWLEKVIFRTVAENKEFELFSPAIEAVEQVIEEILNRNSDIGDEIEREIEFFLNNLPVSDEEWSSSVSNLSLICPEVQDFLTAILSGGEFNED